MYVMYQRAKSERKTKREICLLIIYVVAVFLCLFMVHKLLWDMMYLLLYPKV